MDLTVPFECAADRIEELVATHVRTLLSGIVLSADEQGKHIGRVASKAFKEEARKLIKSVAPNTELE
jgi:hypothetical protein